MHVPLYFVPLVFVTVAVGWYFIVYRRQQQKYARLPPGPTGSPHGRYPPRLIHSWIEQYGPIISLRQGRDVLVIIGRHHEAMQLLERQGASFADRPHSIAGSDILGRGMRFMLLSTCDRLRRFRKAAYSYFQPKAVLAYDVEQTTFARNLVIDLLDDPDSHPTHIKRFSGSVTLRVIYGRTSAASLMEDPLVLHLKRMIPIVQGALVPGAYLVDHFPLLQYFPWYGQQLRKWGEEEYNMLMGYMLSHKSQMSKETGPLSVAKGIILSEKSFSEQEKAYFLGSLTGAAFDTVQVAISTIMIAAARFPEAQEIVYAQLDAIVGRDAPPTFADWTALTELQAFILEALRWRPVNPFGAPRRASKDVFWNGFCIPAGATVFGNHWSIGRDPDVFPEPEKFDPQRWIKSDGSINHDLEAYSFGFGRRTCVGSNLAIRSLYIACATVFWAFMIVEDPKRPIDDTVFVPGIVAHLKPFSLLFDPRIEKANLRECIGLGTAD